MGLLDGILGQVLGNALGGAGGQQGGGALLNAAMGMLNQQGGLGGLLAKFQQNGLGDHAASWVSTGQNMPISPDQLLQVLGGNQLSQIAQQAGLDQGQASAGLAQLLPHLIDKLTPNGTMPQGNELASGLESLKKMFS